MKFIRPPFIYRWLFPHLIWKIPEKEPAVYITFDDGPVPEVTPWVLEELKKYNASATFFCIGENIQKHPEVYQMLLNEGHQTGNHTFNHLKGWETKTIEYVDNTALAATLCKTSLFRPPYGRITFKQAHALKKEYKIIMWDVLSYDFDKNTTPEQCLKNVIDYSSNGSIIVFHDSMKAEKNLRYALPEVLKHFSSLHYKFKIISSDKGL